MPGCPAPPAAQLPPPLRAGRTAPQDRENAEQDVAPVGRIERVVTGLHVQHAVAHHGSAVTGQRAAAARHSVDAVVVAHGVELPEQRAGRRRENPHLSVGAALIDQPGRGGDGGRQRQLAHIRVLPGTAGGAAVRRIGRLPDHSAGRRIQGVERARIGLPAGDVDVVPVVGAAPFQAPDTAVRLGRAELGSPRPGDQFGRPRRGSSRSSGRCRPTCGRAR